MAKPKRPEFGQKQQDAGLKIPRKLEGKTEGQSRLIAAINKSDVTICDGPAGSGKAQPLTAAIMTPDGPVLMGDIKVGDTICTPDGNTAKVGGVYPQGKKPIYRIVFYDGTSTECCEEHLWNVSSRSNGWKNKTVNTRFIIEKHKRPDGSRDLYIQASDPVHHTRKHYKIAPYVMGILLGDGCFRGSRPAFTTADEHVATAILESVGDGYKLWHNGGIEYAITKKKRSNKPNTYTDEIRNLGLMGLDSKSKFIPKEYLYGSVDQRVQLLQGLMDSDGTVCVTSGMPSYSTSSPYLRDDFMQLVQSLGGTARVSIKKTTHAPSFIISVCLPNDIIAFSLPRKAKLTKMRTKYFPKRYIDRVEYVGEKQAQCIWVDSKDHLYLTDHYIVTHNTFLAVGCAVNAIREGKLKRIVICRPAISAGEDQGFLPGDISEKYSPFVEPIYEAIRYFCRDEDEYKEFIDPKTGFVQLKPLAYMRGLNFRDAFAILDEAQNATYDQIKMFISRLVTGSKCVIAGSSRQCDLNNADGFNDAIDNIMSRDYERGVVSFVQLSRSDIIRSGLLAEILEAMEDGQYESNA